MLRLLALILASCALLVLPTAAAAHTKLTDSDPSAETTANAPLKRVRLSFSTDVSETLQKVEVLDPVGSDIAGQPTTAGAIVSVPIKTTTSGKYTVRWRSLGADGHTIKGSFSFTLDDPAHPAPQDARKTAVEAYPTALLQRTAAISRAVTYLTLLILVGGTFFASLIAHGWRPRYFHGSAIILILASLVGFVCDLAVAGEYSVLGVVNPWNFIPFATTPTGRTLVGYILGATLLLLSYPQLMRASAGGQRSHRIAVSALLVATVPAFGGHTWISQAPLVRVPADMLHLIAASIWLGGLVQLREVAAPHRVQHPAVYPTVARFSRWALASVIVLVVTGVIAALLEIGLRPGELFGSTYGRLVLIKIGFLALVVPLANANRVRHVPAMKDGTRRAALNLRRYVVFETILVGLIVITTAFLVSQTPPRHADLGHDLHATSR